MMDKKKGEGGGAKDEIKKIVTKPSGVAMQIVNSSHQTLAGSSATNVSASLSSNVNTGRRNGTGNDGMGVHPHNNGNNNNGIGSFARHGDQSIFPQISNAASSNYPTHGQMFIAQHQFPQLQSYAVGPQFYSGISGGFVIQHPNSGQLGIVGIANPSGHPSMNSQAIAVHPGVLGSINQPLNPEAIQMNCNPAFSGMPSIISAASRSDSPQVSKNPTIPSSANKPGPAGSGAPTSVTAASGTVAQGNVASGPIAIGPQTGQLRPMTMAGNQRYPPLLPAPGPSIPGMNQDASSGAPRMIAPQPMKSFNTPVIPSNQHILLTNGHVVCQTPTGEFQLVGRVATNPQGVPGIITGPSGMVPGGQPQFVRFGAGNPMPVPFQPDPTKPIAEPPVTTASTSESGPAPSVTQSLPSSLVIPPASSANEAPPPPLKSPEIAGKPEAENSFSDMPSLIPGESAVGPTDVDIRKLFMAEVELNAPPKPAVLTHFIDKFVIQESSEPFPVANPYLFDEFIPAEAVNGYGANTPEPPKLELEVDQNGAESKKEVKQETGSPCANTKCDKKITEPSYPKDSRIYCSKKCYRRERRSRKESQTESDSEELGVSGPKPKTSSQSPQKKGVPPATIAKTPEGGLMLVSPRMKEERKRNSDETGQPSSSRSSEKKPAGNDSRRSNSSTTEEAPAFDTSRWRDWTVDEVAAWVRSGGPDFYDSAQKFETEEVDGQVLGLMNDDHMQMFKSMSIKVGPGVKLSKRLKELKEGSSR